MITRHSGVFLLWYPFCKGYVEFQKWENTPLTTKQ